MEGELTRLLVAWRNGDKEALKDLVPLVEADLRRAARRALRNERKDHTLEPTALVHEVYLRLLAGGAEKIDWQNRVQFYALASTLMRRILVDHARRTRSLKRGGKMPHVPLDEALCLARETTVGLDDLLALHDAMDSLAALDPVQARIVELRYFGGLTHEEIAEVVKLKVPRVKAEWGMARAWLLRNLKPGAAP